MQVQRTIFVLYSALVALVALLLKATLGGVEALESVVAKGTLLMVNGCFAQPI